MRMCACRGTAGFAHVSCLAEQAKILMDDARQRFRTMDLFELSRIHTKPFESPRLPGSRLTLALCSQRSFP